jgi:glutamyl-tRNA synthetase
VATLRERAKTLVELVDMAHYFLSDEMRWDEKAVKKFLTPEIAPVLEKLAAGLENTADFSEKSIEEVFAKMMAGENLQLGKIAQPVRVALTGSTVSPGIYEVIAVLGKERTLRRLRATIECIDAPKM